MKLYEIKRGAKIVVKCSDGSKYVIFDHIDGMYSYCTTAKGAVVHLGAVTPLKKVKNYYVLKENEKTKKRTKKEVSVLRKTKTQKRGVQKSKPILKRNSR